MAELQRLSQAILQELFPPENRGRAVAFGLSGIVVAPMLGPVAGALCEKPRKTKRSRHIEVRAET